jgi:hypothetical protein
LLIQAPAYLWIDNSNYCEHDQINHTTLAHYIVGKPRSTPQGGIEQKAW